MDITLRLHSGEVLTLGKPMAPEVRAKYDALRQVASDHALPRQTVPDNFYIVLTVGEELGFWEILALPPVHDVPGRVY